MYYILVLSDIWSLYDKDNGTSTKLEPAQVECLKLFFSGLVGETLLTAMQAILANPNKLQSTPAVEERIYYLFIFPDNWVLYDGTIMKSRILETQRVNHLRPLFSKLVGNNILTTIQVSFINPNKLLNLPAGQQPTPGKKVADTILK